MQDRPDLPALLAAVARFLQKDVQPQIADKGLGFRVLIAAHLCGVIGEVRTAHGGTLRPYTGAPKRARG